MVMDISKVKHLAKEGLKAKLMKHKQYFLMEIFKEVTQQWEHSNLKDDIEEGTAPEV